MHVDSKTGIVHCYNFIKTDLFRRLTIKVSKVVRLDKNCSRVSCYKIKHNMVKLLPRNILRLVNILYYDSPTNFYYLKLLHALYKNWSIFGCIEEWNRL